MINSLFKRSRRYVRVISSITRDALHTHRRLAVIGLLSHVLGVAFMAGSVGAVLIYIRLAETGGEFGLGQHTFVADGQLSSIIILGIVACASGLLAGWLLYIAQRNIFLATRRYYRQCIQRAISMANDPHGAAWCDDLGVNPRQAVMRLTGSAARFTAMTFRDVQQMVLPVIVGLLAAIVVLMVEPLFTLGLLIVLVIYLVPTYRLNRASFACQRDYLQLQPVVRRSIGRGVNKVLNQSHPQLTKRNWSDGFLEQSPYETAMEAYFGRHFCTARMQLVNTSLLIFCVCLIFVYFGYHIQQGERGWAELLIYLTALRFAINSLRPISSHFIKLSKFFSESEFYHRFMQSHARGKTLLERATSGPTKSVTIDGHDLVGGQHTLTIEPGGCVVVYLIPPAGHMDMQQVLWRLRPLVGNKTAMAWISQATIASATDRHGDLTHTTDEGTTNTEPADPAAEADREPVLVIDAQLLKDDGSSPTATLSNLKRWQANHGLLMVVADRPMPIEELVSSAGCDHADAVLLLDENRAVISISDQQWAADHHERIAQAFDATSDDSQPSDVDDDVELDG